MNKEKFVFLLLLVITWSGTAFAQSQDDYDALNSFLPEEKKQKLITQPELYAQMAFLNRHGYYVGEVGEKDISMLPKASDVASLYSNLPAINHELIENKELNLLGYDFRLDSDRYNYYRISGSNKVLVIPPTERSLKMMSNN